MKLPDTKGYSESLSYLTDLNTCIYLDGNNICTRYNKPCSGRKDPNTPCQNKDYKTTTDYISNKMEKPDQNNSN